MKIFYDNGRCGSGKTYSQLVEIVDNPAKYLFAVDKIENAKNRIDELKSVNAAGRAISVHQIDSMTGADKGPIIEQVEALPDTHQAEHQVVFITHKALKEARFGKAFSDWKLIVDEDFSTFDAFGLTKLNKTAGLLNTMFEFAPFGSKHHQITTETSVTEVIQDVGLSEAITRIRSLMEHQKVIANMDQFENGIRIWSIWDHKRLKHFQRVTILANAFEEKLSFKLAEMTGVEFIPMVRSKGRVWSSRKVTIRYFSEKSGSCDFFMNKEDGQKQLKQIAQWQKAEHNRHGKKEYWSANARFKLGLAGKPISPKAAGINDLTDCDVATFIYSARSGPADGLALRTLTNGKLNERDILRDREYEDLCQFVLRGSLRDPNGTDDYEIRVYSKDQADCVSQFLIRNEYVDAADVIVEKVGIDLVRSPKVVKPAKPVMDRPKASDEERREKDRVRKQAKRDAANPDRKRRNRTPKDAEPKAQPQEKRPRGRPRKEVAA